MWRHLDVYKRQARARAGRIERAGISQIFVIPSEARNLLFAHGQGTPTTLRVSDVADTRAKEKLRSFLCLSLWQAEVRAVPRLTSRR